MKRALMAVAALALSGSSLPVTRETKRIESFKEPEPLRYDPMSRGQQSGQIVYGKWSIMSRRRTNDYFHRKGFKNKEEMLAAKGKAQ